MFEDLVEGVRNPRALHLGFRGVYNRVAVRIICTLLVDRHPKGRQKRIRLKFRHVLTSFDYGKRYAFMHDTCHISSYLAGASS